MIRSKVAWLLVFSLPASLGASPARADQHEIVMDPLVIEVSPPPDISALPEASELGRLCFDNGEEKSLDADDVLWAARMIHGETGGSASLEDADAMLWSMAQRIRWSPTWRKKTLAQLVRSYSQPINVKWSKTGKACRKYYDGSSSDPPPDNCSESRLKRRAAYRKIAWGKIDDVARSRTVRFARGELDNPVPGAVGWFARGLWQRREKNGSNARENMAFHSEIERNAFFTSTKPDTRAWSGVEVRVAPPGEPCS